MIENRSKKELEISKIILNYLKEIEDDNSILKGNLSVYLQHCIFAKQVVTKKRL